jgi:hypothetical protein
MQALAGEPLGEQRQEVGNAGAAGKLVVGGVREPFDGLGAERRGELSPNPWMGRLSDRRVNSENAF